MCIIRWLCSFARKFFRSLKLLEIFRLTSVGSSTLQRLATCFILHYLTILSDEECIGKDAKGNEFRVI